MRTASTGLRIFFQQSYIPAVRTYDTSSSMNEAILLTLFREKFLKFGKESVRLLRDQTSLNRMKTIRMRRRDYCAVRHFNVHLRFLLPDHLDATTGDPGRVKRNSSRSCCYSTFLPKVLHRNRLRRCKVLCSLRNRTAMSSNIQYF